MSEWAGVCKREREKERRGGNGERGESIERKGVCTGLHLPGNRKCLLYSDTLNGIRQLRSINDARSQIQEGEVLGCRRVGIHEGWEWKS
jgi:hypothetical protein